jgi:hypothetical protein
LKWSAIAADHHAQRRSAAGPLFREDPQLSDIEVKRAGLAEAFTELTNDSKGVA